MKVVTKAKLLRGVVIILFASMFAVTGSLTTAAVITCSPEFFPLGVGLSVFTGFLLVLFLAVPVEEDADVEDLHKNRRERLETHHG